jgi:hypothetical protein
VSTAPTAARRNLHRRSKAAHSHLAVYLVPIRQTPSCQARPRAWQANAVIGFCAAERQRFTPTPPRNASAPGFGVT